MNLVDVIIILLMISALYRGFELGLSRQLFSTIGFLSGLLLGSFLQRYTIQLVDTAIARSLVALMTTMGLAFFFLGVGEQVGLRLKDKVTGWNLGKADGILGSVIGAGTLLISVWLARFC
jgi:uncharacterized membrane protein required for colicin V production